MFLISAVFVALAIFILCVGRSPGLGVASLGIFGLPFVLFGWRLANRARRREETAFVPRGGARIPAKKSIRYAAALGMTIAGAASLWGGRTDGRWQFVAIGVTLLALGVGLLGALVVGYAGNQYLVFEPEGLRVGNRSWSYLVAWDNVARIAVGSHQGNPALLLFVRDANALIASASGGEPERARARAAKIVASHRTWTGCDVFQMTDHYGVSPAVMARLVEKYASDPPARAELAPKGDAPYR